LFLQECFFWLRVQFLAAIDDKIESLETLREAFEEHCLSRTAVFKCNSRFKADRVSVEDDERSSD
jgi:hypothetical protein